jgi:serine carboxypeptidase 1
MTNIANLDAGVQVYTGQLDLICCTLGVWQWLEAMPWENKASFISAPKLPIHNGGDGVAPAAFRISYACAPTPAQL